MLNPAPLALIDGGFLVSVLVRVLHTACAAVLLGGTVYLRFVLAPAIASTDQESPEATLFAGRRKAWAGCVGAAAGVILLSGLAYYLLMVIGHESMPGVYHVLVGAKMMVALFVVTLSALVAGKTDAAIKVRANAKGTLNVLLAATLTIFLLAAAAKTFPHIPKAARMAPSNDAAPQTGAENNQ